MPPKQKVFVPLRLLSPSHAEYRGKCPAHIGTGSPCTSNLKNIGHINRLLTSLENGQGKAVTDEKRVDTLQEIAILSLCRRHNKEQDIENAVHQWEDENLLAGLQTPQKDEGSALNLEFEPYRTKEIEVMLQDLDLNVDKKIINKLTDDTGRDKDKYKYLYILGHEATEGMYKIGYAKHHKRITIDHERCYPNLHVWGYIPCPNAELFEKLVHLEFVQHRYKHKCDHHGFHTEWFKVHIDDIWKSIHAWSQFSRELYRADPTGKKKKFYLLLPGFDSGPERWHKWAMEWVERWSGKGPVSQSHIQDKYSYDKAIQPENDVEAVPRLSSSSSARGTPGNDFSGPLTPMDNSRIRKGKYSARKSISTVESWSSKSNHSVRLTSTVVEYNFGSTTTDTSPTPASRKRPDLVRNGGDSDLARLTQNLDLSDIEDEDLDALALR
ncbi:hypothetical protein BDV12DRAFT_199701 [Aspergillus spectabilis]